MFKPSGGADWEYVEFQNIGTTPLPLGGVRVTRGVDFTFEPGTTLAARDYLVVCKDRAAFLSRHPAAAAKLAAGTFAGTLSDTGEILALTLPAPWNLNILRFDYSASWYPATSGGGSSLVTRDQGVAHPADWENSETWESSVSPDGSPGTGEPPVITSTTTAAGIVGDAFSYLITATRSPSSFAAAGLPQGLAIDTVTGLISGAPGESGTFPVEISATSAGVTATVTLALSVTAHGEFHHFTWHLVPGTAYSGVPFSTRVTARDIGGRLIRDFQGTVAVSAGTLRDDPLANPGGAAPPNAAPLPSPVLITELTDEQEDQFELQNVSGLPANTAGWFVVLGDSLTNINLRNAVTFPLPATMAPGSLLRVSDSNSAGRTYFGAAIGWNHASTNPSRGWVMLFDAGARLRDFVAFGWSASQLANLSLTVSGKPVAPVAGGHWSGAGLAVGTRGVPFNTTDCWIRGGGTDTQGAASWSWAQYGTSFGVSNAGLSLPWEIIYPLTLTPSSIPFSNGEFLGPLTVTDAAGSVFLTASAPAGQSGRSPAFEVLSGTDTDHDGMPDAWESPRGLSPADPGDATGDADGDGQDNRSEYEAGTDPGLAASVFAILAATPAPEEASCLVEWHAIAGKTYHVLSSRDLLNWNRRGTIIAPESGLRSFTVPTESSDRLFFKMLVEP